MLDVPNNCALEKKKNLLNKKSLILICNMMFYFHILVLILLKFFFGLVIFGRNDISLALPYYFMFISRMREMGY